MTLKNSEFESPVNMEGLPHDIINLVLSDKKCNRVRMPGYFESLHWPWITFSNWWESWNFVKKKMVMKYELEAVTDCLYFDR